MRVLVESFLREADGVFESFSSASKYSGDCRYVSGAISLKIDGTELLGLELWDDVNWLWPLVVQALEECRQTGLGKRGFPDQPISIVAKQSWPGHTLLRVTDGETIDRSAVAPDDELHQAVAHAGVQFFTELRRLCPDESIGRDEELTLKTWLRERN